MRKFKINDTVVWALTRSYPVTVKGRVAGRIIGYYSDDFPILLLATPDSDDNLAAVYHDSVLELKPNVRPLRK